MNENQVDRWIFYIVLGLMAIGIIMVYSASAFYADKFRHDHLYYLKRQFLWVFLGSLSMIIAYRFPYEKLRSWTGVFIVISIVLLVYSLVTKGGRWIHTGIINIQVGDIARLSLILFLADSLSRKKQYLHEFGNGFVPHITYVLLLAGLIVAQPDFSSAAMLVIIGLTIMFISPIPLRYFFYSFLVVVSLGALVVKLSVYKSDRIAAFLYPEQDVLGKGYQIIQSLISLGAGGITGVGYAESSQKMFFLPEAHTDFIFSIIGEEWGFVGAAVVVMLFFILLWRGISLTNRAPDTFSQYLAFGLTLNLLAYALVNMMVAAHLLPPTGLPLPFVSYGGSSMIISSISVGLLLNISKNTYSQVKRSHRRFSNRAQQNWQQRKLKYVQ